MNILLEIGKNIPHSLRIFLLAIVLTLSGGIANAQTDEEDSAVVEDSDDEQIEEVIVTGSRMKRNTFTSVSPLQVVDGEAARDLGLISAQDVLSNTTVISGQQNTVGLTTVFKALSHRPFQR